MTAEVLLLVLATAVLTACANLMMRHGLLQAGGLRIQAGGIVALILRLASQWTFVTGFIAWVLAGLIWFRVLSIAEVSTSYPLLVGMTFALVTVGAIVWFREGIGAVKLVGIAVILFGILLVSRA